MRNFRPKYIILLLGFLIATITCKEKVKGKGESASPQVEVEKGVEDGRRVVLWHSYRGDERSALEEVVSNYNSSSRGIKVELLFIPYDAFADKISAAIPRGEGPDIFIFAHDRIGDWVESGILEPLDFWVDEELKERFLPITMESLYYRKSLYGLPLAFKSVVLFYNKEMVTEVPETTDDLIALAKRLTDKEKGVYGLVYENTNFYHHSAWWFAFGGEIFDDEGKVALCRGGGERSLSFARRLAVDEGIMPQEVNSLLVTSLFNQKKAAMVINGPWFRGEIEGVDYGIAPLPIVSDSGKRGSPFLTVEAVLLSSKSQRKEESFDFMKFLAIDGAQIRLEKGNQPVALSSIYDDGKIDPSIKVFMEMARFAHPMPNIPEMLLVWTPATTALSSVVIGGKDPVSALADACQKIEESLAKVKR